MKTSRIWSWLWIIIGLLYFIVPLLATFEFSLRAVKNELTFVSYTNIFTDPKFWQTFTFSVGMGVITILVSLILVVPTVYWIRIRLPQLRVIIEFIGDRAGLRPDSGLQRFPILSDQFGFWQLRPADCRLHRADHALYVPGSR
jgi:hypothetical protein